MTITRGLNRLARIEPPSPSHSPTCATAIVMRRSPEASPLAMSATRSPGSGPAAGRPVRSGLAARTSAARPTLVASQQPMRPQPHWSPVRVDPQMSDLAGESVRSAQKLAAGDDATADAHLSGEVDQVGLFGGDARGVFGRAARSASLSTRTGTLSGPSTELSSSARGRSGYQRFGGGVGASAPCHGHESGDGRRDAGGDRSGSPHRLQGLLGHEPDPAHGPVRAMPWRRRPTGARPGAGPGRAGSGAVQHQHRGPGAALQDVDGGAVDCDGPKCRHRGRSGVLMPMRS